MSIIPKYVYERSIQFGWCRKMALNVKKLGIFSLLFLFWKSRLMRSPCCLCVCFPQTAFECLNRYLWNLVCMSCQLRPSQGPTLQIPPITNTNITASLIVLLYFLNYAYTLDIISTCTKFSDSSEMKVDDWFSPEIHVYSYYRLSVGWLYRWSYEIHLQPPAHAGSSFADFSTLKIAIRSSETSVHTRSTRPQIPEDRILHSHRRENLKSYTVRCYVTQQYS
jgi:hypothetical protein